MAKIAPPAWDDRRKHLNRLRVNLQNAGFDPGLVQRTFLRREPAEGGSFDKYLRDLIGDVPLEVPEEKVSIFVGPSGSGKTTALLKVAAAVLLRRGIVPRVMYFGDRRSGDPRVLKSSCKRLGIKFKAVSVGSRLAAEVAKGNGEPVLLDPPGIAELGDDGLEVLAGLTRNGEGAVIRLVVNSAMDAANISAIASCIPAPARVSLVLTKLDEATRIGGAVSAAIREGIPVGYLTGGRDFGSGIYVPDRGLLYDRIVEGLARAVTGAN
jgi:flagellar biosynthesis protein FlhF